MTRNPLSNTSDDWSPMLRSYIHQKINYKSRKSTSSYAPSSLMMDFIIHQINKLLADDFKFRRIFPDYHPYILRLYYGVVFIIQCLRAMNHCKHLNIESHITLDRFLDAYPPESLPISGPLLSLFKTLCCSQPEFGNYREVFPKLPASPGPDRREKFMLDAPVNHIIPNVPGIFALLENLDLMVNPIDGSQPVYPAKGKHVPVVASATTGTIFGHHLFPASVNRTEAENWSLVSSGLQYCCEADKKLNESFSERYENFDFPVTTAEDDLSSFCNFLSLDKSMAWFSRVRDVAIAESSYFAGSGTLEDCAPFGINSNQIVVHYIAPTRLPTIPTKSADTASLFPFRVQLKTTARSPPELAEFMAATSQTHVDMFSTHPYLGTIGMDTRTGPFWSIRPVESSVIDETSYLRICDFVCGLAKTKN